MNRIVQIVIVVLIFTSCSFDSKQKEEKDDRVIILSADREAPLGWVYLRIYQDSTFEFESAGLRNGEIYKGKALITEDLICFNYIDSVPKAGQTAIYDKNTVMYIDGKYLERVGISHSDLSESIYDKIGVRKINNIIQQSLDYPELQQYFHVKEFPDRLPLKIAMTGLINPYTTQGIEKFGNPVHLVRLNTSEQKDSCLEFSDWKVVEDYLEFRLSYKPEGIIINYAFENVNDKWEIKKVLINEE
jgi:hypothetical protein